MDKNVSSVNLDELKAARVALDKELGIESDPNMYNDYDPEKHKAEREQEKLAKENQENDESLDVGSDNNEESIINSAEQTLASNDDFNNVLEEDDEIIITQPNESEVNKTAEDVSQNVEKTEDNGELNLNIYDTFADFEINSGAPVETTIEESKDIEENDKAEEVQESAEDAQVSEYLENSSLDEFLKDLDDILSGGSDDDQIIETSNDKEDNEIINDSADEKIEASDEKIETEIQDEVKIDDLENEIDELIGELDDADEEINSADKKDNEETVKTQTEDNFGTEVLSDFSKLSEMFDEMESEKNQPVEIENAQTEKVDSNDQNEDGEKIEEVEETEESVYPKIEQYNFIDIISTEEFKDADNFSYLLGKNEDGELVFSHLKDTCGTAVFTRNEDVIFSGFSSILLSLLLKNTPEEMQFVVCDAMANSDFDVFENSSFMYFNRVAKNNREIVDTLIELSKEVESRYNNLVQSGVKSISAFNSQAEDLSTSKMPYIVVFINNYAKMSQFLDSDKINTCIYNLLKFGRIVGVYVMLASAGEIERKEINHNLPTRIAYKTEDEFESVKAIGFEGAENLVDENDFLYSTIYDDQVQHLKVASLTKKEIELVIENLED